MNVDIKDEKNKQVDIEILVDDFLVVKHLKNSANKIAQSTNIKGFRKGKAPYNIIESQYGKDYLLENSLDSIIQEVAQEVLENNDFEYPCAPKVDILEREPKLKLNLMIRILKIVINILYLNKIHNNIGEMLLMNLLTLKIISLNQILVNLVILVK